MWPTSGERLPLNRQVAALRYALTTKETILQTEPYRMEHNIPQHPYWEGGVPMLWQTTPLYPLPMPECFAGKDVLQVPLYDYVTQEALKLGIVYVHDSDSVTGFAAAASWIRMPEFARAGIWSSRRESREAPLPSACGTTEKICTPVSLEELPKNHYGILKVFDIDGLTESSNTLLNLARISSKNHLSGFAHVLGKHHGLVSMKATGGLRRDAGDPDALWFDRMFLEVR